METFIPLRSANVDRVDYEPESQQMTVTFKSGRSYLHRGVPQAVFLGMQNAGSAGGYYHRQVKDRFAVEEV